jgi:hypothetical protein
MYYNPFRSSDIYASFTRDILSPKLSAHVVCHLIPQLCADIGSGQVSIDRFVDTILPQDWSLFSSQHFIDGTCVLVCVFKYFCVYFSGSFIHHDTGHMFITPTPYLAYSLLECLSSIQIGSSSYFIIQYLNPSYPDKSTGTQCVHYLASISHTCATLLDWVKSEYDNGDDEHDHDDDDELDMKISGVLLF